MDFSHLIDATSPLSPAHQVVFKAGFDLESEAGTLLSMLQSGQLAFNPHDRYEDLDWSILDFVLVSAGSHQHFGQARPLAQWLVSQGQSPWELKANPVGSHGRTGYEVASRHGNSSAAMAWCWEQADAPPRPISPVLQQVIHDDLIGQLAAGREPMSKEVVEWLERRGVGLFQPWSNGQRPVDVLFEHAKPDDKPLNRSRGASARAPHDWLAILRDIARVGQKAIKENAPPDDLFHVRALLWANAHYASLRGSFGVKPDWVGTLVHFDKALSRAWKWNETGNDLHTRAHRATLDYVLSRPGFPSARLAMEVALGGVGEFTAHLFGSPSCFRKAEALLDIGARVQPLVEQFSLGVDPPGTKGWGWDPWSRAWGHLVKAVEHHDFEGRRREVWEDARVWSLAVPALALIQPPVLSRPVGANGLEMALGRGNLWPEIDSWHEVMETHAWSDSIRSQVAARRMSLKLPEASLGPQRFRL